MIVSMDNSGNIVSADGTTAGTVATPNTTVDGSSNTIALPTSLAQYEQQGPTFPIIFGLMVGGILGYIAGGGGR
jgi:hypothetical protein